MKGRRVIDLGRIIVRKGRRMYGLAIFFSPEAPEVPGILAKIAKTLAERGVPIYHIIGSGLPLVGEYYILLFADFGDVDPREIASLVSNIEHVAGVEVIEPIAPGIVIDNVTEELALGGERAIVMGKALYKGVFADLREELGLSAGAIFYHIGLRAGRDVYSAHEKMLKGRNVNVFIEIMENVWKATGFGMLEVLEIDRARGYARVRIYNNFECEMFKGSGKPQGHFTRGIIEGWLEKCMGYELRSEEVKCIAKGDPYCEMEFWKAKR